MARTMLGRRVSLGEIEGRGQGEVGGNWERGGAGTFSVGVMQDEALRQGDFAGGEAFDTSSISAVEKRGLGGYAGFGVTVMMIVVVIMGKGEWGEDER